LADIVANSLNDLDRRQRFPKNFDRFGSTRRTDNISLRRQLTA
jgi:hypothetical protein